jgi:ubiquinone/menaquinone biosynthesis C-methylase UbiE
MPSFSTVACGTGDLSLELKHDANAAVIGTDFCRPMLAVAADKSCNAGTRTCRSLRLMPCSCRLPMITFDAVTIAFGLRNLPDHNAGLQGNSFAT